MCGPWLSIDLALYYLAFCKLSWEYAGILEKAI